MTEPENPTQNPKLPAHLVPGNPGNSGGKKGRSGRTPEWFKEFCRDILSSPKARAAAKKIMEDPDHPHYASMWKGASERGFGKIEQSVNLGGPPGSTLAFTLNLGASNITDEPGVDG